MEPTIDPPRMQAPAEPTLDPVPAQMPEPEPPAWARREYAWPISLAIGFAATWVGLVVPIPGLAALIAALAFLPLYRWFQRHGDLRFATYLGLGWMVGMAGASVGMAVEGQADLIVDRLPFGQRAVDLWIAPWVRRGGAPRMPTSMAGAVELAAYVGIVLLLARIGRGILLLVLSALGTGALSAVAAWVADQASRVGEPPMNAAAFGWPPAPVLVLLGAWAAGCALADPAPLGPWRDLRGWRRKALLMGTGVAVVATCVQPIVQAGWAEWVQRSVGG